MKIDKDCLEKSVGLVMSGVSDTGLAEQSAYLTFKSGRILSFNDMVSVSVPFKTSLENCAVPASTFANLLRTLTQNEVDIEQSDGEILIRSGRSVASLRTAEAHSPALDMERPKRWEVLHEDFAEALRFCVFSASADESQPILMCIHVYKDRIESCDNYRATRRIIARGVDMPDILLPRGSATCIKTQISHYGLTDGWIHFKNKEEVLHSCRTYNEGYPSLDTLLQVSKGEKMELPEALRLALPRASIFSSCKGLDGIVNVSVKNSTLSVSGTSDAGWYKERIGKVDVRDISFNVNPSFLLEALSLTDDAFIRNNVLLLTGKKFVHAVSLSLDTSDDSTKE